jgi:hypothetical protein
VRLQAGELGALDGESMVASENATESQNGGFTLRDLILLVANGCALPLAVSFHLGRNSAWLWLAYPLGVASAFFLTWQWKKLEWRAQHKLITAETSADLTSRDRKVIKRVFFGVLVASVASQYLLYRLSGLLIRSFGS